MCGMLSCKKNSFLEANNTTNLTQSLIFSDSAYTVGFLANIYANVYFAASPSRFAYTTLAGATIPCGGLDAASDESDVSHTYSTTALSFAVGAIDQNNVTNDAYNTCYTQIRAVNQLFANIAKAPLLAANKTQMKAEARFLRAYYYFILLEHYGGVALVGNSLYTYTQPISAKRATFAQTVTYITTQLDSAAMVLPITQNGSGLGRASAAACEALKARVLLYAASPLFNTPTADAKLTPNGYYGDQATIGIAAYPDYQLSRWSAAQTAAYQIIESNLFQLYADSSYIAGYGEEGAFQQLFTERANSEYIFQYDLAQGANYMEGLFNPPTRTGANGAYPYENTVEAFPMQNGKAITDPTSGYNPSNPYANRDPRLRYSIIYNGALLGNRTPTGNISGYSPVNISVPFVNGVRDNGTPDEIGQATTTGYYGNKMVDPQACSECNLQAPSKGSLPIIRYAEILLDFAEAENEVTGPTDSVYWALESIRKRAGISPGTTLDGAGRPTYGLAAGMTQVQMRAAIQVDRQVELAFEGHRFFDVRRWLIAATTESQQENGMQVDSIKNAGAVQTATYNIIPVRKHNFTTKMYLWPFPQTEIGKGQGLVQNPGY